MVEVDAERDRASTGRSAGRGVVARLVAYGLPLALVVIAALDLNAWPATGWRLFSGVREGTQATWLVDVVDGDGEVRRYDPASAGPRRSTWRHSLDRAVDVPDRQAALCEEWLAEARSASPSIRQLQVRRAVVSIPTDEAARSRVEWERVVVSCSA